MRKVNFLEEFPILIFHKIFIANRPKAMAEFTFSEAVSIWKNLLPEFTLDYLFDDTDRPA